MAQTAKTKFTIIGVIVAAIIIALVAWSYHKKSSNTELVIGISPPFANPLKVAVEEAKQQGINVKLLKCGGVAEAIEAIHTARRLNMRVLLGCMIESSIGVTAAAHLAHLADWIDLDGHLYVANDDFTGVQYDESGNLLLPDRPGIGVELRVG